MTGNSASTEVDLAPSWLIQQYFRGAAAPHQEIAKSFAARAAWVVLEILACRIERLR